MTENFIDREYSAQFLKVEEFKDHIADYESRFSRDSVILITDHEVNRVAILYAHESISRENRPSLANLGGLFRSAADILENDLNYSHNDLGLWVKQGGTIDDDDSPF